MTLLTSIFQSARFLFLALIVTSLTLGATSALAQDEEDAAQPIENRAIGVQIYQLTDHSFIGPPNFYYFKGVGEACEEAIIAIVPGTGRGNYELDSIDTSNELHPICRYSYELFQESDPSYIQSHSLDLGCLTEDGYKAVSYTHLTLPTICSV